MLVAIGESLITKGQNVPYPNVVIHKSNLGAFDMRATRRQLLTLFLAAALVSVSDALIAGGPAYQMLRARSDLGRRSSGSAMALPLPAAADSTASWLLESPVGAAVSTSLDNTSLQLSEGAFDLLQAFAGSPAILLVPIGGGLVIASIIIFILVKSAG